jgi:hypothetical protein
LKFSASGKVTEPPVSSLFIIPGWIPDVIGIKLYPEVVEKTGFRARPEGQKSRFLTSYDAIKFQPCKMQNATPLLHLATLKTMASPPEFFLQ